MTISIRGANIFALAVFVKSFSIKLYNETMMFREKKQILYFNNVKPFVGVCVWGGVVWMLWFMLYVQSDEDEANMLKNRRWLLEKEITSMLSKLCFLFKCHCVI